MTREYYKQSINIDPTELRLFLRSYIYDEETMEIMKEYIENNLDCTSIIADPNDMVVQIKIKKTKMKKHEDYSHNVIYYYPLITKSILSFLDDNRIRDMIYNNIPNGKDLYDHIRFNVFNLFNAVAILDNSILIGL